MDWREKLKQMTSPQDEDVSQQWHAVFVKTGEEEPVKEKIDYTMKEAPISAIVPKRSIMERKDGKWHERIKPLFPGYILLKGQVDIANYYALRCVPGVVRILKDSHGLYRIYPEEIRIINKLMCNGDIIGSSIAFKQGDKVIVTKGPLLGLEGLITTVDSRKGRAKVKLSFLGDERTVDLSISFVETA
jgi:transcriptional antiterminator NusG